MMAADDAPAPNAGDEPNAAPEAPQTDPVRRLVRRVALLCAALFVWYVASDHYTPYSDQARVDGYVVPVVPEVSGPVIEVEVEINQLVDAGQLLLKIDPRDYQLAVEAAEADLERAGQNVGTGTAEIAAAQARLADAKAQLANQRVQTGRRIKLEGLGAASETEADRARAQLSRAEARLGTAEADLQKAIEDLGDDGRNNTGVRSAMAALEKARDDLAATSLYAPSAGGITNVDVGVGQYATAGQPIMTFISASDAWVIADLRENSLGNIQAGDEAETAEVCYINYGVTFTMVSPSAVRGSDANPLFKQLAQETGKTPSWNFNKYLVDSSGNVVQHFDSGTRPDSKVLEAAIESVL